MALKDRIYRLSLSLVPPIYLGLTALWFATFRVREHGRDYFRNCAAQGPFIATIWHYSIFYSIHRMKGKKWVAMVSGSKDAEYISRLMEAMGFAAVRGSRGKGGLKALRSMEVLMQEEGRSAAIIADGSQGPPRQVQAGAILLASRSGAPIVPSAWAADRYFKFKSWDRTLLPKPFAKIVLCYGEPMLVPKGIKAKDIEKYRLELEQRLNGLYRQAWQELGMAGHGDGADG